MEGTAQSSEFTKKYRMYTRDLRQELFSYEKIPSILLQVFLYVTQG